MYIRGEFRHEAIHVVPVIGYSVSVNSCLYWQCF